MNCLYEPLHLRLYTCTVHVLAVGFPYYLPKCRRSTWPRFITRCVCFHVGGTSIRSARASSTRSSARSSTRSAKQRTNTCRLQLGSSTTPLLMQSKNSTAVSKLSPASKKPPSAGSKAKETPKAKNSKLQPKPNGLPRLASVPDKLNPDEDPMRVMFYACEGKPKGLVVFAPGSRGGMGPGQSMSTIGQFNPRISSIYPDVAKSLSSQGIASVHLTWRLNPTRKGAPPGTLKSPTQLMLGVADIALAARYLRAQYGKRGASLPLVLVGFSFGGPSTMAAGALAVLPDGGVTAAAAGASGVAPISGVVTIGCGMRVDHTGTAAFKDMGNRLVGGASRARPHHYNGVDSESCVDAYAAAGLPLAMIHGLADVTVDPRASATIFARARGPKAALWLEGTDHQARTRFDIVSRTLIEWLPLLLERPAVHPAAEAPSHPCHRHRRRH